MSSRSPSPELEQDPEGSQAPMSTQQTIKAHITSLVTALGAPSRNPQPGNNYKLGINALAVLKDLKRWLRFDQQVKKADVALAVGETTLVSSDIVEILRDWEESFQLETTESNALYRERVACLCLELLVPLTWPLQIVEHESTVNQLAAYHRLKQLQALYKKEMLQKHDGVVLKAVVRLAIPIILKDRHRRLVRENSILNLCVLFMRNVLAIGHESIHIVVKGKKLPKTQQASTEDISIEQTIQVFSRTKSLKFLLTVCAGLGSEFDDSILGLGSLECLYYLLCHVAPQPPQALELGQLLLHENHMKSQYKTLRHARFGTLLLFGEEASPLAVSGQKAISLAKGALQQLDSAKKWRGARHMTATRREKRGFQVTLDSQTRTLLDEFCGSFMDGAFNPFVKALGKRFYGDDAQDIHKIHYCTVLSWFLQFEYGRISNAPQVPQNEESKYGLFGAVLYTDSIRLLKNILVGESENKDVLVCYSIVVFFTVLLEVLSNMAQSLLEHDVDVAVNTMKRLFTDEAFLHGLVVISRNTVKKDMEFAEAVVALLDWVFRVLEGVSDGLVLVKKARKSSESVRRKFKERVSQFLYNEFVSRFMTENTTNGYVRVFKQYKETKSLKKCLKFFHKIMFSFKRYSLLMRLDFVLTMYEMLSKENRVFLDKNVLPDLEDFFKYYMKTVRHLLGKNPIFCVEMLFPKFKDTQHFLETGEQYVETEKPKVSNTAVVKPLEFREHLDLDLDQKIGILVTHLNGVQRTSDYARLLRDDLANICDVLAETDSLERFKFTYHLENMKKDVLRNAAYRLLLGLVGFQLPSVYQSEFGFVTGFSVTDVADRYVILKRYLESNFEFGAGEKLSDYTFRVKEDNERLEEPEDEYDAGLIDDNDQELGDEESDEELEKREGKGSSGSKRRRKHRKTTTETQKTKQPKKKDAFSLAMYIDSEDELSDDEQDKQFYAREKALREFIDRNGGSISKELYNQFMDDWEKLPKSLEMDQEKNDNNELSPNELELSQEDWNVDSAKIETDLKEDQTVLESNHRKRKLNVILDDDDDDE